MNEVFEVLTVRDLDFKDDRGKDVVGMQLWLIRETDEKEWNGFEVLKVWIPDGHPCEMAVAELKRGDMIQITWNRKGKAVGVQRI